MCILSLTSSQGVKETRRTPDSVLCLEVTMSTDSCGELPYASASSHSLSPAHHEAELSFSVPPNPSLTHICGQGQIRLEHQCLFSSRISILFRASTIGLTKIRCFCRPHHPVRMLLAVYLLQPSSRYGPDLRSSPGRMSKDTLPSGEAQQRP